MQKSLSELKRAYDTVVIGAGLSGLITAKQLSKNGQSVLLIDRNEATGGDCRGYTNSGETYPSGLKVIPATKSSESAIRFLSEVLEEPTEFETTEAPPITFEAGFKPFVGFGDQSPDFADEIEYYTQTKILELSSHPVQWVETLFNKFFGDYLPYCFVTRINIEEGSAKSVFINGSKTVHCQNIVFAGSPADLPVLIGQDNLSNKVKRGLAKGKKWTAVSVDYFHSEVVAEEKAMHVLMGNKDKTEPCWGRFLKPVGVGETDASKTLNEPSNDLNIEKLESHSSDLQGAQGSDGTQDANQISDENLETSQASNPKEEEIDTAALAKQMGKHKSKKREVIEEKLEFAQQSQWMTLIDSRESEDTEMLAGLIKKISKQLKRAYPDAHKSIVKERILVSPMSHGQLNLTLTGHQTIPGIENIWVSSQFLSEQRNLIGTIGQAQLTLAGMGFPVDDSQTAKKESNEESSTEKFVAETSETTTEA